MIFTESTIKISNNVSKMDSTIVLYRGDKNVEIRFTILQSPFKYSNTVATNVIESTNASYGQLVIKTPNDKPPIFSEVSATKEGTVLFTITKEMIDEIEELGVYTFQIRLMDENKQSRVTIPPVENGIEIKEPIAIEDDNTTNVVGLAKANYAVATLSDADIPTFDDNGKYNKTNWNDGDIITNASLNKIEDGIYATNENVTATKKYVDDGINYDHKQFNNKIVTMNISKHPVSCSTEIYKKPLCDIFPELLNITYNTVFREYNSFKVNMDNFAKEYPTVKSAYNKLNINLYDENDNSIGNSYGNSINGEGLNIIFINITESLRFYAYFDKALVDGSSTTMETKNGYMTIQLLIPKGNNKQEFIDKIKNLKLTLSVFRTDFLNLNNETMYTPTTDYNPATKKYVDDNMKTAINDVKGDLGTEELNTTAKNLKGAVNELNTQCKDIASKTITTEERTKLTSLENYDDTTVKNDIQTQKARIDSLTTLTEGSTTGDAELIDGRTGADGVTYTNIGDAIRAQCGNLNTLLDIEYEPISNNCIDDSKYVGKNFDSIFGHSGNKKFKLDKKLTSSRLKGYIELEDGTQPSTAFQIYLASTIEGIDGIQLSIGGTYISAPNFDKYDIISVDCWSVYDKNIKTFFIGNYDDEYDNFKTRPKSKTINTMETKLTSIQPEQCSFFTKVNNLLKNVALQKGYGINPNYGMPDKLTGIERTTTDFMELRDDCKSTYCNINGYIYYYDENKKYLQSISPQNLETPAGIVALPQSATKIKYIRYTFVTEDDAALATYWITDQGKPYENDKLYIPKDIIEDMNNKTESWYKGKKICAYGDSVTEQNKWQSFVSSYFNCSFCNRGVGGTTVTQVNSSTNHMSADSRIETIPTDSDVILVFGGHNDWSSASINIGDIKTEALSESTSFKSAFALMLKKIQTRCPNAKIITMTPVGGRTEEASVNQDKQFYIRDLCMTDFANAVKEVSAYYGIPCIDINGNSGINTLNHTTYIADVIHPNSEGGKLIANEVINGLKRFEPIVF